MGQEVITRLNDGSIDSQMLIGLIDMGVKGLLLMAAAGLAAAAMRKHAAAARHLVWLLALCGLLLLPVLTVLMPKWTLPILPAVEGPVAEAVAPVPPPIAESDSTRRVQPSVTPIAPPVTTTSPAMTPPSPSDMAPVYTPSKPPAPANYIAALWPGWLIIALLTLAPFIVGVAAVSRMRRRAESFTELESLAADLAKTLDLKRTPRLLRAPTGTMPMATGLFAPAVFLPADALAWTEEKRRVVLLHELAHIKRRDCLTHAIARVAVSLHWLNPLAWLALRQLRIEREHACDDLVLAAGERPSAYAENLLEIARTLRADTIIAAAITMAQKSQLEGRLLAVLDAGRTRGSVTATFLSTTLLASTIILALLSTLGVVRQTPHEIVFASGLHARVVGVAMVNEADSTIWTGSGTRLSQFPVGYPRRLDDIDDSIRRAVFVEVNIPDDVSNPEDVSVKARSNAHWEATELIDSIPRRIKFSANVSHGTKTPDDDVRKRRLTAKLSMPDDATTFDLEVGIASGAWKAVTADIAPGSSSYESPDDFIHEVMTSQPYERDGKAAFSVTYSRQPKSPADTSSNAALGDSPPSLHDLDWRIVVWNTDGVEFLARSSGGTTSNNLAQWESVVEDLKPDEIVRIDLQVRDYEWKKFEDIALNPDTAKATLNSEISESRTDLQATPNRADGTHFPDAHVVIYNGSRGSNSYAQHDFGPRHGRIIPGPIGSLEWTYHGPAENGGKFSFRRLHTPDFPGRTEATAEITYNGGTLPVIVDEHQWIGIEAGKQTPILPVEAATIANPIALRTDLIDGFFAGSLARQARLRQLGVKVEFVQRVKNNADDPDHVDEYFGTLWMRNGDEVVELKDAKGRTARHYQIGGIHISVGSQYVDGTSGMSLLPGNDAEGAGTGPWISYVNLGFPGFNLAQQWNSPHEDDEARIRESLESGHILRSDVVGTGSVKGIPFIAAGIDPVVIAPQNGFAWLGHGDVTASDLFLVGENLWFPRKVVNAPIPQLVFDGSFFHYYEEISVTNVTLAPDYPEGLFTPPEPTDGVRVVVPYLAWDPTYEIWENVARPSLLASTTQYANFRWSAELADEDRGIFDVWSFWRNPETVNMALDSGGPLPYYDRQSKRIVYARYDNQNKRISLVTNGVADTRRENTTLRN